jgi:hypothetical protein
MSNNLPLGLPFYPGARIMMNATGEFGGMVTMATTDAPDKVNSFYEAQAEKLGMTIISSTPSNTESMSGFVAKSGSGGTLNVTVDPYDEELSGYNRISLVIETN